MPVRQRKPNEIAQQIRALCSCWELAWLPPINSITFIDDEATILDAAAQARANDARARFFPARASTSTLLSMISSSISGCDGRGEISITFGSRPFYFFSRAYFFWAAPPARL